MRDWGRIDEYLDRIVGERIPDGEPTTDCRLNEPEVHGLSDLLGIGRCPAQFLPTDPSEDQLTLWADP